VKHATDFDAISCGLGPHINEGRWLRDPRYLETTSGSGCTGGQGGGLQSHYHQFSNWTTAALYDRWLAGGSKTNLQALFDALQADYSAWDQERMTASGLSWQRDVSDGMGSSISGGRKAENLRPTINGYMYAISVSSSTHRLHIISANDFRSL